VRILHVTDHYPPGLGGIETHVAALAARQAARGDDVTVLTRSPAMADAHRSDDAGPVTVRRARDRHGVTPADVTPYDIVHAHLSVMAPFTSPVAALAARCGAPTMVTVHSMWNRLGPLPTAAAGLAGLLGAPVVWTAVSRTAARHLAARLPGRPHVTVLPNAVDVRPRVSSPRSHSRGTVRLVSTMRLARRKRPLQLLSMFDRLSRTTTTPVHLTIVGDGPLLPRVERRLRRDGLCDSVTLTGRVEPDQVLRQLHQADLYVAPAVLESFGLAALEARCVGLPVVGLAAGGLNEFVRDGVEGWLGGSDTALVDRLRDLVEDDRLRHAISEHNRTTPSTLTWAAALDRTDAAYALAGDGSRTRVPTTALRQRTA
jgi:glycosyltransferase involved in cell wall biosynthesis